MRRYDVLMVTDCRLPGGTSASVAEEIVAQAAGGYRTGLVQVDSSLVSKRLAFNPRIIHCLEEGQAELVLGTQPVEAELVVLRHPTVAGQVGDAQPAVEADRVLLVANQAPGGVTGPSVHYDPHDVDAHVRSWTGLQATWTPIGPLVRENLARLAPDVPLTDQDWVNVIDVDRWRVARPGPLHRIPVIGRHSRNAPGKWPATKAALLEVYPDAADIEVHVLGGADTPRQILGGNLPPNWVVHEFGAMAPERFLGGLDVYVYYHHPDLVEAFGRTILEAMASGLPPVLPPHFRNLFADACTYAPASEAVATVHQLFDDAPRYRERSQVATEFVREHFGHEVHRARLAELATPTGPHVGTEITGAATRATSATAAAAGKHRVLYISSNGAGVGHLMRLMSIARRTPDEVEPIFLTLSQAAQVVHDEGYLVEYLPSRGYTGAPSVPWHEQLRARLVELIDRYDVDALVFDGTMPYWGVFDAADDRPGVRLVWSRRAMWKKDVSNAVIEHFSDRFDLIIEPGEFAADLDRGATRDRRAEATVVEPITFLGLDELLDRDAARAELGLDPDRPAALVHLGAGNINDTSSQLGMVVDRLAQEADLQVCVTRSIIAAKGDGLPSNVRSISVYPLARYLPAFDLAFAASGYNSYHELVLAGVPTAYLPNLETATDDQGARSDFADRVGVGLHLPVVDHHTVDAAARVLLDPERRRRMHERAVARRTGNGADTAAAALAATLGLAPAGRPTPKELAERRLALEAPPAATAASPTVAPAPSPAAPTDAANSHGAVPASSVSAGSASERPAGSPPEATPDQPVTSPAPSAPVAPEPANPPTPAAGGTGARPTRNAPRRPGERTIDPKELLVKLAANERVRKLAGRSFYALPDETRAKVRRKLKRWDTAGRKKAKRARQAAGDRLPIKPGDLLPIQDRNGLIGVAIVFPPRLTPTQQSTLVDAVAQLQLSLRSFAPLLVTSCVDFEPFRTYGLLFEYVPGEETYARVATAQSWSVARRERLRDVFHRYRIQSVVTIRQPQDDGEVADLVSELRLAIGALRA
jgi:hypothetical protein